MNRPCVDLSSEEVTIFAGNNRDGPCSKIGMIGEGIERPFDVKFSFDGAMYIVDYGEVKIHFTVAPPYNYQRNIGVVWKITKDES